MACFIELFRKEQAKLKRERTTISLGNFGIRHPSPRWGSLQLDLLPFYQGMVF